MRTVKPLVLVGQYFFVDFVISAEPQIKLLINIHASNKCGCKHLKSMNLNTHENANI